MPDPTATLARFICDERGTASFSFALWLPFIMGLIMLVTDVSMILFNRSNVERLVQDTNRLRATGALTSSEMAEQYLTLRMTRPDGTVFATVDNSVVMLTTTSVVSMRISDIDVFGLLPPLTGDIAITVRNQQTLEDMEI